jgi:D-alanyl-lipoteichoic acid acyltransferase DltB (MBOAT superfamily)
MDAASIQFVLFGLIVAIVSNFSRARAWRSSVLLIASFIFLGLLAQNPIVFLPLIGFLLLGYIGLVMVQRGWSRLQAGIVLSIILAYLWLKKYTFLPEGSFLSFPYFTLGLSYIFFRVLQLIIESADTGVQRSIGPGAYLTYTLNFTTFVSGPIQGYDQFARDQFAEQPIPLGADVIGMQVERIIRGFFKVNVLAMLLNMARVDAVAQMYQPLPVALKLYPAFRLSLLYPFFLYCNFSGYIDIVIGLARLMRIRLPENFDRPFTAASVLDFWNRWHITLSNWLKTYVYNPLLMVLMRRVSSVSVQPFLGVFCFFVTFFLVGVWHGRTSEFIMFGLLTGAGISINKLWQVELTRRMGRKGYRALATNLVYTAFGRGLNLTWFAFTLFWFWANWKEIDTIFAALSVLQWLGVWLAIWLFATALLTAWEWLRALLLSMSTSDGPVLTSRYARVVYATALGLIAFVMTVLLSQPAPDIVYKAF